MNIGILFLIFGVLSFFLGWMSWFMSVVMALAGACTMWLGEVVWRRYRSEREEQR